MTKVQGPAIGNALRTALDLDAAGGMPMDADTTIVPVAIVADVRELLSTKYIPVQQIGIATAVAGEYSYCALEWMANALPRPRRLLLDSITVSVSTASQVQFGFISSGIAGTQIGLPRRKVGSLQSSSVAGRIINDTEATAPSVLIDGRAGLLELAANQTYEIVFREPIILDQENQFFGIGITTVNLTLRTWWQWREERS